MLSLDFVCTASKCPYTDEEKDCALCEHFMSVEQLVIDSLEG